MHMQTIHLSLFAWMCSILMHTQCDMLWMKENLIKGYPKFICKIVFMGIAKTLLNVTGYANVICSKVWESAYQALHRGMIVSDCLPLGWLAIRPISIDGIHPSLSVGKNNIERNEHSDKSPDGTICTSSHLLRETSTQICFHYGVSLSITAPKW